MSIVVSFVPSVGQKLNFKQLRAKCFKMLMWLFTSREGSMRSPQAFLPATLFCMDITHPVPHNQLANQRALPVSLAKYCCLLHRRTSYLFKSCRILSCSLWNKWTMLVLKSNIFLAVLAYLYTVVKLAMEAFCQARFVTEIHRVIWEQNRGQSGLSSGPLTTGVHIPKLALLAHFFQNHFGCSLVGFGT